MKKIAVVPLDERPCNYVFPSLIGKDTDYEIVLPPHSILGKKKIPGDVEAIWEWMFQNAKTCDAAVISVDMLIYSGIVPSRLHHFETEEMLSQLEKMRKLREINPSLTIYAFSLIMRNPRYSSSDEEPDYYEDWGSMIHRFGVISHLLELGIATEADQDELKKIKETIPPEHLGDYLERRAKNIQINKKVVELAAEGVVDFVIIPQDDASLYGLTAQDQRNIRKHIRDCGAGLKVYMYPDADAVVNTLLARYINRDKGVCPMVYIKYASSTGNGVVPLYEDRIVSESIKYQILAAGGLVASSVQEADIVLLVNVPSANMKDLLAEVKYGLPNGPSIEYDASRNLVELVEYGAYAIEKLGKCVVAADIAYANGGDEQFFELLLQRGILFQLAGYAGWNTSSNSLGTCIPLGMVYSIYGERKAHHEFLAYRYIEDIGFCARVRREVTEELAKEGYSYRKADGIRGSAAAKVKAKLDAFAQKHLSSKYGEIVIQDAYLPWSRMFEVGLEVVIK